MPQQDPLKADHKEIDKILDQAFAAVERGDKRRTLANLDYLWARLGMHIRAEHLHLFPILLKKALDSNVPSDIGDTVSCLSPNISTLRSDHDFFVKEIGKGVNRLRDGEKESGKDVDLREIQKILMVVADRLAIHNELEEKEVYSLAQALLTSEEILALTCSIRRELANVPHRFRSHSSTDCDDK